MSDTNVDQSSGSRQRVAYDLMLVIIRHEHMANSDRRYDRAALFKLYEQCLNATNFGKYTLDNIS